ncbi:MAG: adenylate/guanylate cyclase domain-containing protein [Candidatus Riflebacteria bacterium]|nr:adenylate/guanylate cyclase domain-containing protein [Candidatus Riflebacteria bacterium]
MSGNSSDKIVRTIKISTTALLMAWLMVLVLPLCGSLLAIDYFIEQYGLFAEPAILDNARQKIEECRNLLVIENFIASRVPLLEELSLPADSQTPSHLKRAIDEIICGEGLLYIFFDKTGRKLKTAVSHPSDLTQQSLPPAPLFRNPIENLTKDDYLLNHILNETISPEKQRNALLLQQIFKTITAINVRAGQVSKNFSVAYGGELYLTYFEFKQPMADFKGCFAVVRGCDISWQNLFRTVKKKYPAFSLTLKKMHIQDAIKRPDFLYTGIRHENATTVLTAPADQRFIRSYLHKGGLILAQKEHNFKIPFIQYRISTQGLQKRLQKIRNSLGAAAKILVMLSLIQLIHMALFGINLNISFKRRILASAVLVSIFPYSFFGISFYLHKQYDDFLAHLNLLQHVEIKLMQINNELTQFMEKTESNLVSLAGKIDKTLMYDKAAVQKLFAEIGEKVPVSEIALHRPDSSDLREYAERISAVNQNSTTKIIERFIPKQGIAILLEPEPVVRVRKDMVLIAGNAVKSTGISDQMISNGKFYYINQGKVVVWYSTTKLFDESQPQMPFIGLLSGKFEAGPLIKSFLQQSTLVAENFEEAYGNYQIKFAFMPTQRTGSPKIWPGTGHCDNEMIKKTARQENSSITTESDDEGNTSCLVSRYNENIPHVAIALATTKTRIGSYFAAVIGLFVYLGLVFYLISQLLEKFFVAPVIALARSAEQIARGKDVWNLSLTTGDEFEQLNNSFSELVVGLRQRNMLRDYVSEDAISEMEASDVKDMAPGGEYIEATIIFATIRNYSELTADFPPEQTVEMINRFITAGDHLVKKHGGTIDKIIDSTLMLVFRDSETQSDSHALRAARTALELAAEMHQQNLDIYAGIASGTVISGRIGSYTGKLDFTVIGDQVNLAARLKTEAVDSVSGLIISGSTMRLLKGKGRVNFLRRCSLKGKAREYNIYELYELR